MKNPNEFDVVIIGAGVGGLTAGLKLSHEGKKVFVLEKQPIPGGFATTFKRKNFIFESAVHCVDALAPDEDIRNFLEETGVSEKIDFIKLKNFSRIIYPHHDFVIDFKKESFIYFLKKSFPQENRNIDRIFLEFDKFYRDFDRFCKFNFPDWLNLLLTPILCPKLIKASSCTFGEYIGRFTKHQELLGIIGDIWRFIGLPPSKVSAFYFLVVLRGYYFTNTDYIKGGFGHLFEKIVEKIKENGGQVKFDMGVKKIVTFNKIAKKVILANNEEILAKTIISNANALDTLTNLLDDDLIKQSYRLSRGEQEKSISAFQVYLGLKVPAEKLGMNEYMFSINNNYNHDINYMDSFNLGYDDCPLALVDHAQIDPSLVPEGKGSLMIMVLDSYSHWKDLEGNAYKTKKDEVANKLISRAAKYLPGLLENIELIEAATPKTMERYVSSPQGAIYGFSQTVLQSGFNRLSNKTKIKGLFLAGAWTFPGGGVHGCFVSGLEAADLALDYLKKV